MYGGKWDLKVLKFTALCEKPSWWGGKVALDDMCCVHVWVVCAVCGWVMVWGGRWKKFVSDLSLGHTHVCDLFLVSVALVPAGPVPPNWTFSFRVLPSPSLLSSLQPLSYFFNTTLNSSPRKFFLYIVQKKTTVCVLGRGHISCSIVCNSKLKNGHKPVGLKSKWWNSLQWSIR